MTYRLRGVRFVVLLAATALLALAPAAYAQEVSPTDAQYSTTLELIAEGDRPDPPGDPVPSAGPNQPTATEDRPVGGLPFTGLEVGGLLAAALALGGTGLLLRRVGRERSARGSGLS